MLKSPLTLLAVVAALLLTSAGASAKTPPKPQPAAKACYVSEGRKAVRVPCKQTSVGTAPKGFKLVASAKGNAAKIAGVQPHDSSVNNPVGIDIRVVGGKVSTSASLVCSVGSAVPQVNKTFKGAGLFPMPVPKGAQNCDVIVAVTGTGTVTVQVYAKTGRQAPPPKPKPAPKPTPYPFDGTWQGTFTATVSSIPNNSGFGRPQAADVSIPVSVTIDQDYFDSGFCGQAGSDRFCVNLANGGLGQGSPHVQISTSGSVTGLTTDLELGGFTQFYPGDGCDFSMQFSASTATSTPIACQWNSDPGFPDGYENSLTRGLLQLARTS